MKSLGFPWRKGLVGAAVGALVLVWSSASVRPRVPSDAEAQQEYAKGAFGQLGPGTGLRNGKGWVVSMTRGKHEFRVRGGGRVYLTTARFKSTLDFDLGRLYYISVEDARPDAVLEWRILGSDWGPVSMYFLYPPVS